MDSLTEMALSNLAVYGIPVLLLVSYVGSLGIPFPISIVIIAAGAFTHEGLLDWRLAILACLLGAAMADNSEYLLGHLAGRWLKKRSSQKFVWKKALSALTRQGCWAILLTRFWLTPLAPAVNVVAGSRYPYTRFLLFDLTGQLVWVLLYGGLGYLFASQWKLVSVDMSQFSGLSFGLVVLAAGIFLLMKWRAKIPVLRNFHRGS